VAPATREAIEAHTAQLVALDRRLVAEQGRHYSAEPWTNESFRAERPLKFELSLLGFWGCDLGGFAIASRAEEANVHIHRFGVDPAARGSGLAAALAEGLHSRARAAGAERITLYVSQGNDTARRFYERVGYTPMVLHRRPGMEHWL
jgi:ribosomal protein S18 acetylase RimI-like enzyme